MSMSGFICHDNYYDRLQRLTDEEVGHLFRNLMLYHAGKIEDMTDFVGVEGIAFDFIKDDIDRMEEKHTSTSETNRINGSKGGRPKKQPEPEETEQNRQKPTETEENPTKAYKDKDIDKDIDKEKNKEKEKVKEKETPKRFIPPTVEDVSAYCRERGNGIDAEYFVAYYTTRNWIMTNGKKMSDWKSAVITWEKREKSNGSFPQKVVAAQQYEQRDYDNEQAEAMRRMLEGVKTNAG